jgi:hypothetical protein
MAGTNDRLVPAAVVKAEKNKFHEPAVVNLKDFKGRTHGIVAQDEWE